MTDLELAAYHEAGHAVMAQAFDLRVSEITLELREDGRARGECRHEPCGFYPELMICLAGIQAEARVLGHDEWSAAFSDDELIERAAGDLVRAAAITKARPDLLTPAFGEVRRLLATPDVWADVEMLAKILLRRMTSSRR